MLVNIIDEMDQLSMTFGILELREKDKRGWGHDSGSQNYDFF